MPKFNQVGVIHLIPLLIVLVIVAIVGLLLYQGVIKTPLNNVIPGNQSQQPEVSLQTQYQNPFDKSSQYVNPFSSYKNPFDSLKGNR